mgnify:CR=1 FL=1
MTERVNHAGLQIDKELADFVTNEAVQGLDISAEAFWQACADVLNAHRDTNRALLEKRETLQQQIDEWHKAHRGEPHDVSAYKAFLQEIGYLVPEGGDFTIETANVDEEIAKIAGPQLVVPIKNARFAINAANARWGSLYDAFTARMRLTNRAIYRRPVPIIRCAGRGSLPVPKPCSMRWHR